MTWRLIARCTCGAEAWSFNGRPATLEHRPGCDTLQNGFARAATGAPAKTPGKTKPRA